MCDCTGSVTHALSQRRAQRLVAAHHTKGVIVPGDAHQIARSRWEMLLFLSHTFNHLKKRPVSGTLLSVRRLAERWTASKGQLLRPCSYHFHAFPRVLPIRNPGPSSGCSLVAEIGLFLRRMALLFLFRNASRPR